MNKIFYILLVFLLVSCGKSSPDSGTVVNAHDDQSSQGISGLKWSQEAFPVIITVPTGYSVDWENAISNSAETWNDALGFEALRIVFEGDNVVYSTASEYLKDDIFSVAFPPKWINSNTNILAATSYSFVNNRIIHADVIFNMEGPFDFIVGTRAGINVDLQSVVTHEFGHLLGMEHVDSSDDPNSIMNPKLGRNIIKRDLSNGDVERIQNRYQ